jgi:predicted glycosyltransferase
VSIDRRPRALFYVQHLLGVGHLARASRIVAAMVTAGIETTVATGGPAVPEFGFDAARLVPLDPVKVAAADMSRLLGLDGAPFDDARKARRRDALLALLAETRPDILLIEAFPFGRRPMRFELLPLLDAARAMGVPLIATSIRDILQEKGKPGRDRETVDILSRFFDLVLAHGDGAITPLAETFPLAAEIPVPIAYTGIVGPPAPAPVPRAFRAVVSAGGGVVGGGLVLAAVGAARRLGAEGGPWLVLTGHNLPAAAFEAARAAAPAHVTIERFRPNLAAVLAGAGVSISQAGYNTVADIMAAGCRAVLVPFAVGGETEQSRRAALLAAAGRAIVVAEAALDAELLARAIRAAEAGPTPVAAAVHDGAGGTARILLHHLAVAKNGIHV